MLDELRNPKDCSKSVVGIKSMASMYECYWKSIVESIEFGQNERIMDYGCGTGLFFKNFLFEIAKEKEMELIGVDISQKMKDHASANSFLDGITEYHVGNIMDDQNWPFQNQTFDRIFASYVVQDMGENYRDVFRKFNQALIPGGTFTAVIPMSKIYHIFFELGAHPYWSTKYECGGSKYWASWVAIDEKKGEAIDFEHAMVSSGFKILDYHHHSFQLEYKDINECLDYLIYVNGPLSSIPTDSEDYVKLKEDLIENARNFLGVDVHRKPYYDECHLYWFTGKKRD